MQGASKQTQQFCGASSTGTVAWSAVAVSLAGAVDSDVGAAALDGPSALYVSKGLG